MADLNIVATKRVKTTKGSVNKLRKNGMVPGVLYSKVDEPVNISVSEISLKPLVYTNEMHLVNLKIDENKEVKSLLKDIQFHPVTDRITHVDFQALTGGQVIQVQVPITIIGQAIGLKEGGKVQQNMHKLDIECLPSEIPQQIEVDISGLHIGDSIHVKEFAKSNFKILSSEDSVIISIIAPKLETEESASTESGTNTESKEPEVISKGKSEEKSEG